MRLLRAGGGEASVDGGGGGGGAAFLRSGVRAALPRLCRREEERLMATVAAGIEELIASYLELLAERTPRSHELRAEAEQVLAGGVSGHFKAWQPFYVREAKGAHLTDVDGNDYVDLIMGFGPNFLGHSAPVVRAAGHDLAAVLLEPVPYSNIGGEEPDHEFLRALRELTWERGVLLVFDEVITGFRLGLGGAAAHFGVTPDLHCFGKTVGGGFPVGVFGGRRDVMEAVVRPRPSDPHAAETIFQSGTFSGAPPAMAAGLAMLRELERTDAIAVADARAEAIRAGWREIVAELGLDAQVTGISSWLGLSFTNRPIRTRRDALTADPAQARAFSLGLLAGGVYLAPSHPGFTSAAHTGQDVRHVLEVSGDVLERIGAASR